MSYASYSRKKNKIFKSEARRLCTKTCKNLNIASKGGMVERRQVKARVHKMKDIELDLLKNAEFKEAFDEFDQVRVDSIWVNTISELKSESDMFPQNGGQSCQI